MCLAFTASRRAMCAECHAATGECAMRKKPNPAQKLAVKLWSDEKCLRELRAHAIEGNTEWVRLLLDKTEYRTYPLLLTRNWWIRDAAPKELLARTKIAAHVTRTLLDTIPRSKLPKSVATRIPESTF